MKLIHRAILLLALCFLSTPAYKAQQGSETPLTNTSVIKLVRAGFKEKTVVAIIRSRPNQFNLDPDHLIELKRNGVGENIILAMLSQDESFSSSDDGWSDDSFFRSNRRSGDKPESQGNSTDIFGSSGGSNSQSSGRGAKGSNGGQTTTTGSATVRILRPPSEAGGAPAKLERTPTLDNDAIVRLVDAGFSEGTIIKRIEDSPAEFDLSPAKVEDLRKHRVSDAIITAMTAAMAEDGPPKPNQPGRNREN